MRIHFGSRSTLLSFRLLLILQMLSVPAFAATATATTMTVVAAGSPVTSIAAGTIVTLTASVKAGSTPVSPGLVNFCDAAAKYCTDIHTGFGPVDECGHGGHPVCAGCGQSYQAVFAGTKKDATSTSGLSSLTVTGPGVTTTQSLYNGSASDYTLLANVSSIGSTALSGTVSFHDTANGNALLGMASLGTSAAGLGFLSYKTSTGGNPNFITTPIVATGDLNGDGKTDLIVGDYQPASGTSLTVMLGNGDGTFTPAPGLVVGEPTFIVVADFNGDGKADLAVGDDAYNKVRIFLGNGDGTFTTGTTFYGGSAVNAGVGDFNGDGIADLAVASQGGNQLYIFVGNGDGTFRNGARPSLPGDEAQTVVVGDFNNDGIPDLAATSYSSSTNLVSVTILLGDGTGAFTVQPVSPATESNAIYLVAGDFNGDGKADLAVANGYEAGQIYVFLGNGDATFNAAPTLANGIGGGIALADINGDGIPDLVAINVPSADTGPALLGVATIWLGNGDGTFTTGANPPTGLPRPGDPERHG